MSTTTRPTATSRVLTLLYGASTYLLFLGTFLYTIGFLTGFGVPKSINDGRPAPLTEALLVNGGFLALFAICLLSTAPLQAQDDRENTDQTGWQWQHLSGDLLGQQILPMAAFMFMSLTVPIGSY